MTMMLSACMQYLSKKKTSCLCEAQIHDLHITARRSTTQKLHDALPQTNSNSTQTDILRTRLYMWARSGLPKLRSMVSILSEASQIHAMNTIIQGLSIVLVMYPQSW